VELTHQSFVDLAGGKVEAGQVLVSREAGGLDLIGDRADLALGHFCLEQLGEHRDGRLEGWCALFDQIAHGLRHAVHLEAAQHHDDGGAGGVMPPGSQHARISLSVS
jgi:hypothetical protein